MDSLARDKVIRHSSAVGQDGPDSRSARTAALWFRRRLRGRTPYDRFWLPVSAVQAMKFIHCRPTATSDPFRSVAISSSSVRYAANAVVQLQTPGRHSQPMVPARPRYTRSGFRLAPTVTAPKRHCRVELRSIKCSSVRTTLISNEAPQTTSTSKESGCG